MKITRVWSMPNPCTFDVAPIADLLDRWIEPGMVVVDPFARDSKRGTITNDLNPGTTAEYHMDAAVFCGVIGHVEADAVLFDPPYSPRQISECYRSVGRTVGMEGTQNGALYRRVRDALDALLVTGGLAFSFGWNSAGFGKERGYSIEEILLVAHGGALNDTICVVERKRQGSLL